MSDRAKEIIEALKAAAIITSTAIAAYAVIFFTAYFITDHFGIIAAIVFLFVLLFGAIFLSVLWASQTDRKDGEEG